MDHDELADTSSVAQGKMGCIERYDNHITLSHLLSTLNHIRTSTFFRIEETFFDLYKTYVKRVGFSINICSALSCDKTHDDQQRHLRELIIRASSFNSPIVWNWRPCRLSKKLIYVCTRSKSKQYYWQN